MGQRHQVYVINKSKNKYTAVGAFHHQWCYGITAASNLIRLVTAAQAAKSASSNNGWASYSLSDPRQVETLVKAIYGVNLDGSISMVHNEAEYLIEDDAARPERGDNNDGCALLVIDDDAKEMRACMFSVCGVEAKGRCTNWRPMTPKKYLGLYYNAAKLAAMDMPQHKAILATEVKPVSSKEFNKIFEASIKAESTEANSK